MVVNTQIQLMVNCIDLVLERENNMPLSDVRLKKIVFIGFWKPMLKYIGKETDEKFKRIHKGVKHQEDRYLRFTNVISQDI